MKIMKSYLLVSLALSTLVLSACYGSIDIKDVSPPIDEKVSNNTGEVIDNEPYMLPSESTSEDNKIQNAERKLLSPIIPEYVAAGDLPIENTVPLSELEELDYVLLVSEEGGPEEGGTTYRALVGNNTNTMEEAVEYYHSLTRVFSKKSPGALSKISIDGKRFLFESVTVEDLEGSVHSNILEMKKQIYEGKDLIADFHSEYNELRLSPDFYYAIFTENIGNSYVTALYKTSDKIKLFTSPIIGYANIISEDNRYFVSDTGLDAMIYSLIENDVEDEMHFIDASTWIRQMRQDGELLYTLWLYTCLTANNRTESSVIGQYMYDSLLSPDGKYLAYTVYPPMFFSEYVKYNDGVPIDKKNQATENRLRQMAIGIYILELSTMKTAFLPLELDEESEGFNIDCWAAQEPIDQFIKDNK